MNRIWLGILLLLGSLCGASAQQLLPIVVSSCGTPPTTYSAGRAYQPTMDTTGTLCAGGASSGSGTSSTFGHAFPSTGTAIGLSNGTNMVALTLGQAVMASSIPVTIASDQSAVPVTGSGSAGTAASGVVTVQGITSMTPLLANPGTAANWGVVAQGSTTSGQVGPLMQAAVVTGVSSYTNAQTSPLNIDGSGNLKVNLQSGSIGSLGSFNQNHSALVTPTLTNSAYASGNGMGGFQTVAWFRAGSNFSGMLTQVAVQWGGTETVAVTFYIFDKAIGSSTCGDKAAVSLLAADLQNLVTAPFTISAVAPVGTTLTQASVPFSISMQNHDTSPGQNLYVCAVSGGVFTPATTDFSFTISGIQD